MRKYTGVILDTAGNISEGVSITVYLTGTTTEATLYSNEGITQITNPVTSNSNGRFFFYIADGEYDLKVSGSNITTYTISDVQVVDAYAHINATDPHTQYQKESELLDYSLTVALADLKTKGPWVDVRAYDTLVSANTAAYNAGLTLLITKECILAANTTLTAAVKVIKGGSFKKASTYTLTINGPFEAGLYQVFSEFSAGDVTFGPGTIEGVSPEWWGGKADDLDESAVANTAAFVLAEATASAGVVGNGLRKNLLLSCGVYKVTATPGNYAVTVHCPIKGEGPNVSIIKNIGTGSALRIEGVTGEIYYSRWSRFSVVGNASSENGIVLNIDGDTNKAVGYSHFDNIDSLLHGGHGLVHRYSWATKYTNCKFHDNGGLGVNLYAGATSEHNNIIFQNCDSRWNGGNGNASADFNKGGVRISGNCTGVYWLGGVVESNNAWGFIIGEDDVGTANKVVIRNVYLEDTPVNGALSATGGLFRLSARYRNVSISGCTGAYGGSDVDITGYAFYVVTVPTEIPGLKEWDNYFLAYGAGTCIRDYGITYAEKWNSNFEIINLQADRDFSGTNNWVNGSFDTFDKVNDLSVTASAADQYCFLPKSSINNGAGFVYGKRYGIKYDAVASGVIYFASFKQIVRLPNLQNGKGQAYEFTWLETDANQSFILASGDVASADIDNISIYEIGAGISPQLLQNGLLSVTGVSLAANNDTVIFIVPTGKRCVLYHAILVAGADAGATTTISIGDEAATYANFIPTSLLSNLDLVYDSVILMPIPNTTPLKLKSYAAGSVIYAHVADQSGGADNALYLFGIVY